MSDDQEQQVILATFRDRAEQAEALGNDQEARAWLEGIVELDETDVDAWLALARLIPDPRERMQCYSQVLQVAPGNDQAKLGLRRARRELR